tara:strand:+ start:13057 stop:14079 length:1023 start_codon:yes stop_codon:yes gene_type:complete
MPAGITKTDGMAYTGKAPWHTLGVKIEGDAMTASEAIESANMSWEVDTTEITTTINGNTVEIPNKRATYRKDTGEVLGVVGKSYTPVQNKDTFDFFDAVVGNGDARYDTVGTLNGGKKIWLLAKFNESIELDNGDNIDSYLLLKNSHDGSSALTMQWCDIRVVCYNTFEMAKNSRTDLKRFYARHTKNVIRKANQAKEVLQLQTEYQKQLEEQINTLVDQAFDSEKMEYLAYHSLGRKFENWNQTELQEMYASSSVRANADTMIDLFSNGIGNKGKTKWDAYNAITEFTSHHKGYGRNSETIGATDDRIVNSRMNYNFFGKGVKVRERAMTALLHNSLFK